MHDETRSRAIPSPFATRDIDWTPQAVGAEIGGAPALEELLAAGMAIGIAAGRPAVTDRDGTHSYAELDRAADALARALSAAGVRPGDAVVIHVALSRWAIVAMLGVLRTGAHYVPVDTAFPLERRAAMIRESGAAVVVLDPRAQIELPPGCAFQAAIRIAAEVPAAPASVATNHDRELPAYTLFTSGSSGTPKGVAIARRNLAYSTWARLAYYPSQPTAYLLCSSISFDSSVAGIYWALACGAHLVVPAAMVVDTGAIRAACARHRASHLLTIPSLYQILLEDDDGSWASLQAVIVAGEACPPALVRSHFDRSPAVALYNEYGPTECTVWTLVHRCVAGDGDAADVPIGRPIPGTEVYLRTDDGPAATGQIGELWLGGPGVALGYASEPASARRPDRIYRTGDFARLDDHGAVHYHGRRDGQLKLAGARIELQEIEHAMSAASDGRLCAIGVVRAAGAAVALVGFVVAAANDVPSVALRRHLRSVVPLAAVPGAFIAVAELPRLANGKLDRHALDRLAAEHVAATR